ncbi:MAG: competence protein ComFC [Candidatus Dependentiae bacterium]|nr:competence protein ComFC [Candidatus Dependentiae bacterium]
MVCSTYYGGLLISRPIFKKIISLLYPSFCAQCRALIPLDHVLCDRCYALVPRVPDIQVALNATLRCTVRALSRYSGVVAHLVCAKERRDIGAAQQLGRLAATYCIEKSLTYDLIIPVPLHWSRYLMRGYNQAAVMAQYIALPTGGRCVQPCVRTRATKHQKLLEGRARKANVVGAFGRSWYWSFDRMATAIQGKKVLLVDDVYTTGHTLNEFARVIARFKPSRLETLVACRVV